MGDLLHTLNPAAMLGVAGGFLLFAAAFLLLRRSRATGKNRRITMKKTAPDQQNQRRLVTRGQSDARRAYELLQGYLQSSSHGLEVATQLRRTGREQEAARELLLERRRYARRVARLSEIIGIDGGSRMGFWNAPRIREWLSCRVRDLDTEQDNLGADQPLNVGKAILYRVTGGPRSGACYALYLFQKASVEHYTKLAQEAHQYLQHAREEDARELLRKERDRCVILSFLPGQKVTHP